MEQGRRCQTVLSARSQLVVIFFEGVSFSGGELDTMLTPQKDACSLQFSVIFVICTVPYRWRSPISFNVLGRLPL